MATPKQSFPAFLLRRMVADRLLQSAASLAYTTLLSLVPLTVVVFSLLTAFPVFDNLSSDIQHFVFSNFVPAAGEVVEEHLSGFADKASRLTATGILFLVIAAVLLIASIDQAFNMIWHTRRKRNALYGFMMYWALLTLAPLLMGVSIAVTSYLTSIPFLSDAADTLGGRQQLLRFAPFFLSAIAFTLIYVIVPNVRVRLRHAIPGGLLAAALFEVAKRGFAFFVTQFPTYEMIYGALAAVPIFLVWIYLCWLIALTGAEFTYCLGMWRKGGVEPGMQSGDFLLAFRLAGHLVAAQRDGQACSLQQLDRLEEEAGEAAILATLEPLAAARLVHRTEEGDWAFSRPSAQLTLADIFRAGEFVLPAVDAAWAERDPWNQRLAKAMETVEEGVDRGMKDSLDQVFAGADEDDPSGGEEPPALRSV